MLATLQAMGELHAAAAPRRLWPAPVDAALGRISTALRVHRTAGSAGEPGQQQLKLQQQEAAGGAAAEGERAEEEEEEARRQGAAPEARAAQLASRRAAQLAPACVRLVKELSARAGGKGD